MQQIVDLQKDEQLARRDIELVSIFTNTREQLLPERQRFGITTPMLIDSGTTVSWRYQTIGKGMMKNTAGHSFVLVDKSGQVRWRRDFSEMYVRPERLLSLLPNV